MPGSGKTSLITAIAGELRLPVYVLRLQNADLDDDALCALLNTTAPRAAVLLEDVDAAFAPLSAAAASAVPAAPAAAPAVLSGLEVPRTRRGVTFSGLLNALDGMGAAESRLLFMTTNHLKALPPALVRDGRVDVPILFDFADAEQAARLFHHFHRDRAAAAPHALDDEQRRATRAADEALRAMADAFAAAVPAGRFTMAALQGHLLRHRAAPAEAVRTAHTLMPQKAGTPAMPAAVPPADAPPPAAVSPADATTPAAVPPADATTSAAAAPATTTRAAATPASRAPRRSSRSAASPQPTQEPQEASQLRQRSRGTAA